MLVYGHRALPVSDVLEQLANLTLSTAQEYARLVQVERPILIAVLESARHVLIPEDIPEQEGEDGCEEVPVAYADGR